MDDVLVTECINYEQENVDRAVSLAFNGWGINEVDLSNCKVLIKPNILMGKRPEFAVSTHPRVMEAIIKILKTRGCEIIIGESSGWNTEKAFETSGIKEVADRHGVKIIVFDKFPSEDKKIDGVVLKEVTLTKALEDVDYVVNACKMKTHSLMKITGAVKNCYGFVPGAKKAFYHTKGHTEKLFGEMMIDIYSIIKPKILINIMDAIVGMEGDGPGNGDPKNTGLILASKNALALDVVAAYIMGFHPEEIESINAGAKRFNFDIKKVPIVGEYKPMNYARAGQKGIVNKVASTVNSMIFKKEILIPEVDTSKCVKCAICAKNCPVHCITLNPYPKFDRSICIKCYCCHEHCPHGAMYLKKE